MLIPEALRSEWGDYVWWDRGANAPQAAHPRRGRREVAGRRPAAGGRGRGRRWPTARRSAAARLRPGPGVRRALRPEDDRGADLGAGRPPSSRWPATSRPRPGHDAVRRRHGAEPVLQQRQQGPRHLPAGRARPATSGKIGGNVGSYAGNYRVALFNGAPQYINENPFDIELDPAKPARPKQYWKRRVGPLLQPRGPSAAGRQAAADRQDAHADARPSRCGSPTPTRSSATSSGTTTRWSTCCRGSR